MVNLTDLSFAPGGQSTQMVIGASPETDLTIMRQAGRLYQDFGLRRVYYSGYVPVNDGDARLPHLEAQVPVLREHRLYQAAWRWSPRSARRSTSPAMSR